MSEPRTLLEYEDADGESITILWDPVDDTGEDVRVIAYPASPNLPEVVVRVPLGALRAALSEDLGS